MRPQALCVCRVSYPCKLRFVTRNQVERPFIAEVQHFARATRLDGHVMRLAVCRLMRATNSATGLLNFSSAAGCNGDCYGRGGHDRLQAGDS